MPKRTQTTQDGGNTKLHPEGPLRSRKWCFTFNNYDELTQKHLISYIERSYKGSKMIIAHEVGKQGTPHLQGYVEFKNAIARTSLQDINKKIHWEAARGSLEDNVKYISKEGDVFHNTTGFKPKKPLKKIELWLQWQKDVLDIIREEPDDRTVHWYWEPEGNTGKTTLLRYLIRNHGAVPLEGKKDNILCCAARYESEIYVYDIERSLETYVSYGAIEKIKNGCYMSGKYESEPIDRNPPHVLIFANFPPNEKMLSKDRWHITKIDSSLIVSATEGPSGLPATPRSVTPTNGDSEESGSIDSDLDFNLYLDTDDE